MLVQTNDGFAGVDSLWLRGLRTRTYDLRALDAGTEANNEMAAYVPGAFRWNDARSDASAHPRSTPGSRATPTSTSLRLEWSVAKLTITPITP